LVTINENWYQPAGGRPGVYLAEGDAPPVEVPPPTSPRKYWTRREIAKWLVETSAEDAPRWSASTTAFRFRCGTLSFTIPRRLCWVNSRHREF